MKRPDLIYKRVIEVDERIRVIGKWETRFHERAWLPFGLGRL